MTQLTQDHIVMPRKTDKRARLIAAAMRLIHQQGFNETTLADIAQEADVPLGNVYYYFKTKGNIGEAVIEHRSAESAEVFSRINQEPDAAVRLCSFLTHWFADSQAISRYGCSIGGLCQELGKQGGTLSNLAAKLLHDTLKWTEEQFKALGISDENIKPYALNYISHIQGTFLLTHTFKDTEIAQRQSKLLLQWLKEVLPAGSNIAESVMTATVAETAEDATEATTVNHTEVEKEREYI